MGMMNLSKAPVATGLGSQLQRRDLQNLRTWLQCDHKKNAVSSTRREEAQDALEEACVARFFEVLGFFGSKHPRAHYGSWIYSRSQGKERNNT